MDAQPTLNDQIVRLPDSDTSAALLYRACSCCRHFTVPTNDTRKMCQKCRNKRNERARAKTQAKALLSVHNYGSGAHQQQIASPADPNLKCKSETTLRELVGEEQRRAIKEMKASINKAARRAKVIPEERKLSSAHTEYQKASALYDAIKSATSGSRLCNFAGCHSIVKNDSIDHYKRARMVVKDLRKIVKIPFKYDIPVKGGSNGTRARLTYSCTCLKSSGAASVIPGNENVSATETACSGLVVVIVRSDDSHPLGIPGQQIIVEITH